MARIRIDSGSWTKDIIDLYFCKIGKAKNQKGQLQIRKFKVRCWRNFVLLFSSQVSLWCEYLLTSAICRVLILECTIISASMLHQNKNPFKKGCVWSRGMFRYQWDGLRRTSHSFKENQPMHRRRNFLKENLNENSWKLLKWLLVYLNTLNRPLFCF